MSKSDQITVSREMLEKLLSLGFDAGARFETWRNLSPDKSYAGTREDFIREALNQVDNSGNLD